MNNPIEIQVFEGDGKPCLLPNDYEMLAEALVEYSEKHLQMNRRFYKKSDDQRYREFIGNSSILLRISERAKKGELGKNDIVVISQILGNFTGRMKQLNFKIEYERVNEVMNMVARIDKTLRYNEARK